MATYSALTHTRHGTRRVPGVPGSAKRRFFNRGHEVQMYFLLCFSSHRYENTSAPGIYALGDATTTGYELTPVAIAAGRRLADRLFGGEPLARIAYEEIPTVVFSHPPIGTIGLTEPQAREQYGDEAVQVKSAKFANMMYSFNEPGHRVRTGLKLVLEGSRERVVGLHCIGPSSDEMLQGFAIAVKMGATRRDFEATMARPAPSPS